MSFTFAARACALAAALAMAGGALAKPIAEHTQPGGFNGLQRIRGGFTSTSTQGGSKAIALPAPDQVYFIPMTVNEFDESSGARFSMSGDGCITILKSGLYQINANVDWPAQARGSGQDGYDVNYRKLLVKRVPAGVAPPAYTPGQVTLIPGDNNAYDDLTAHDTPGSDAPRYARAQATWSPGKISKYGFVYMEVALSNANYVPQPGDLSQAAFTQLTDAVLGADNIDMHLSTRVVAPGKIRVAINNHNDHDVMVPGGVVNVVSASSTLTAGNSVDAWSYAASPPVYLLAGEKLFLGVRSGTPGDFLQITNVTFLQVMNLAP